MKTAQQQLSKIEPKIAVKDKNDFKSLLPKLRNYTKDILPIYEIAPEKKKAELRKANETLDMILSLAGR